MTSKNDSPNDSILIIAAEASSCMYAKLFIKKWKEAFPQDEFFGVGDREMESMGVKCFGYAEEIAVMGLLEVVKHWKPIKEAFRGIEEEVQKRKPKFALLLDYPGFNLRLAKKLKKQNVPVVYYISPQLWAWKKGRVKQIREFVDHMLVVFPFEVDFYKSYQMDSHFVGHPLVEVVDHERSLEKENGHGQKVLGLMPGSRHSEIEFNLPAQLATAEKLKEDFPELQVKILLAPTLKESDLNEALKVSDLEVEFVKGKPTKMILGCEYILTASGTATLQVALCERPMVVMYRMNSITAFMAKKLVNTVSYFCIVNLIADKMVVPEFFQEEANPNTLYQALKELMVDQTKRETMLNEIKNIKNKLGHGGATQNLFDYLKGQYKQQ